MGHLGFSGQMKPFMIKVYLLTGACWPSHYYHYNVNGLLNSLTYNYNFNYNYNNNDKNNNNNNNNNKLMYENERVVAC